ncbi:hypothetical protein J3628_003025 [Salmonella enterica subsp. enterica serovar Maracaibo]|nr:hypothetical protein [Salmonella enterica subsp. enterica serovar Maracaibo]HAK7426484.1 hypothetical protein [Salmonella enterica]
MKDGETKGNRRVTADSKVQCVALHQAAVLWAIEKQVPVTLADIRKHFAISARSAGDVMSHLCRAASDVVDVDEMMVSGEGEGRRRRKAVLVRRVSQERFALCLNRRKTHTRREQFNDHVIMALRTWFISRKCGEGIPDALRRDLYVSVTEETSG